MKQHRFMTARLHSVSTCVLAIGIASFSASAMANDSQPEQEVLDTAPPEYSWKTLDQTEQSQVQGAADVQLKYDGLDTEPLLNISANNGSVVASRNGTVEYRLFSNYRTFIDRAEVRIFALDQNVKSEPLAIIGFEGTADTTVWQPQSDLPDDVIYVLRVYDENGRFDETEAKPLSLFQNDPPSPVETLPGAKLVGYGIDRTAFRNISVKGGSVTIFGTDAADGASIKVDGRIVPIDSEGKFAYQQILPFGDHTVDIHVVDGAGSRVLQRDVHLAKNDIFYVALGDVTLGTSGTVGPADFLGTSDQDFDDVSVYGRGALYLRGRVNGDWGVTAAIDTGEERLEDIFSNLDEKDPRQLLRRLDSDRFYPVYGDDSTIVEDAPTQGRFYLRVEKDDSHFLWGNFATQVTGTEFAHLDRGLYGAIVDINSKGVTSFGERESRVTAFAADPGTVPAREEFRGTGGSVYFLNRQDLSIGSERVRVEVRNKVSGLVIETRDLRPQEDYDVDYIQGRILLTDPLQSTVADNQVVRDGALSGNDVFLVVRYEFTPTLSDVGGYTLGGRATQWLGDTIRLGVTAQRETTDSADQNLLGADVILRKSAGTYVKAEYAQTDGPGFAQSRSTDGGFLFEGVPAQGLQNQTARAYRVEGSVDFSDLGAEFGQISGYYDLQEDGFSGSNRLIDGEVERWGGAFASELGAQTSIALQYDEIRSDTRGTSRAIYGDISQSISESATLSIGVRHDDRTQVGGLFATAIDGSRTDASLQVDYAINDKASVLAFGQATLDSDASRQSNNRAGIGGSFHLNERLRLNGEVSGGDGGIGANAQATFQRSDNSEVYLGYSLSADRTDTGFASASQSLSNQGTLTLGAKTRFNDSLSVYGEERFGFGSRQSSQTHVYGLTFNPSEVLSFGANVEAGQIEDAVNGSFDRTAVAFSVGWADDVVKIASNLEARFEDGLIAGETRDRTTWLMRNTLSVDTGRDFEMLSRFNFAISDSDQSDFLNADFVEGVVGLAYRPVDNDRLNGLFKYTYFEDLAPAQQISSGNQIGLPRQRSQILSIDFIYDLTDTISIGGKYGYRSGEVALDRGDNDFVTSNAHLAIARLDYHLTHKWDLLGEVRWLSSELAQDERLGALFGIYRHVGSNAKVGVGYSFSSFSDDLTNFENNNDGFFVNLVGKL